MRQEKQTIKMEPLSSIKTLYIKKKKDLAERERNDGRKFKRQLKEIYSKEETYWRIRSKVKWIAKGHKNTLFSQNSLLIGLVG